MFHLACSAVAIYIRLLHASHLMARAPSCGSHDGSRAGASSRGSRGGRGGRQLRGRGGSLLPVVVGAGGMEAPRLVSSRGGRGGRCVSRRRGRVTCSGESEWQDCMPFSPVDGDVAGRVLGVTVETATPASGSSSSGFFLLCVLYECV